MSSEDPEGSSSSARRDELARSLARVGERIDRACADAGRTSPPTLVVVTKFFPRSDVDVLVDLGVRDVGENKAQELADKFPSGSAALAVHFLGQMQSNKAGLVADHADVVHSVDRLKTARALDRRRAERGLPLDVLLQVSLDGDPSRGGVSVPSLHPLAHEVSELSHLRMRGLMAVAPRGLDPDVAFAQLRAASDGIRAVWPDATWISAGMSGDLEAAVRHGATHLRVGSAILGSRPSLG